MLAYFEDKNERICIKSKPFGCLHMLFTGDFY